MVDVKEVRKQVQDRLSTARETVLGAGENARSALTDAIAKAEKAGRDQVQELMELEQVKSLLARAEEIEPKVMNALENRLPPVYSLVQDLNQRLARKSAEVAEKPAAAAPKKAAARKAPAKKAAAKSTTAKKKAPARKPAAKKAETASA